MARRFIAGAVCPTCGALDRLVIEVVTHAGESVDQTRCVACGHSEQQSSGRDSGTLLPRSRLERSTAKPETDSVEDTPVRIVSPSDNSP